MNLWGILDTNLDLEDSPVHSAWNEQPLRWEPDHARLSDFFTTMAYWQAANGALPNLALGRGDAGLLSLAGRHWPEVGKPGERWGIRIFSRDGQVVCVLLGPDAGGAFGTPLIGIGLLNMAWGTVASLWTGWPPESTLNSIFEASPSAVTPSTDPTSIPAMRTGEPLRTLTLLSTTAYSVN